MFEGAVAGILNRLLGKYVQDLDTENLNVGIFSGSVNLTELKLKPEALYELDLPIDVKIGTIGRINLQIPWTALNSQPVVVNIEDVLILVGPAISNSHFDPEREKRLTRAAKRKILQDLESESEILKGPHNFFEHLFTAIVNNLQIYVRNIHIRYEDSISAKDGPLACGLCLQTLSIETTNSKWKPSVTPVNATTVYQMMRIEALSLYWNAAATALDDAEIANLTPMQYYSWKHYMLTGLHKFSMHREDFEFLLKPVSCKVKVLISRSGDSKVPRLLLDAVIQDSSLQMSRRQYLSVDNLLRSFKRIELNRKYRHLHPGVPLSKDIKSWWKYAYNAILEQRVRPYTWKSIQKHRQNYNMYKQTYKSTLRSPNDTELKLDLQKCEDSLPIVAVVIAREQAKFELLSQEPELIKLIEKEHGWSQSDEDKTRVLCVNSSRHKSAWSHLAGEERRVFELIGNSEYIEHKINLTLANCSLTLLNRNKEILSVTLTQFLASLETRHSANSYKFSARAESITAEGMSSDGSLCALVSAASAAPAGGSLLALDVDKPSSGVASYVMTLVLEPLEVVYSETALTELINFFQTRPMTAEDLSSHFKSFTNKVTSRGEWAITHIASRKKVLQINADIKGPCLILPEYGCLLKPGHLLILDIKQISIRSALQSSPPQPQDCTCMELEERLYDRLHCDCQAQLLFCLNTASWRELRRLADSDIHLIPRVKAQVVFSNSIKKDYRLLPKYKLNVSLSSLKLNLSERSVEQLLDLADNLPPPQPTAVPLQRGFGDNEVIESLKLDKVDADPEYKDLIKLREKIVTAYLSRNKVKDSDLDSSSARLGFQTSDPCFISSEQSDEEMELYARSVDLPGFDDNVSPGNSIETLLRFIVGEIVINISRGSELYTSLHLSKLCVDVALLVFGPALQLSARAAALSHARVELLSTGTSDLVNLLYRKVRSNCPEFKSHFHNVEQSLVVDVGPFNLLLHSDAIRTLYKDLQYLYDKVQSRHAINFRKTLGPKVETLWNYLMKPEADPPVPSGATKFSYSVRAESIGMKLCNFDSDILDIQLTGVESDCVFRANDRCIFKLSLTSMQLDLLQPSLYPKLVWPECDKVLELKYVRAAPRYYGAGGGGEDMGKAHGELRLYVRRMHIVFLHSVLQQVQQFMEPFIPSYSSSVERLAREHTALIRNWPTRINLVVEINAPVLLLPQKSSSPNLLVLNLGDLTIENFFKKVTTGPEVTSPLQTPVIDNILIKLANVTLSRAVMTLAGTLEVQEPILSPVVLRCDTRRHVSPCVAAWLTCDVSCDVIRINMAQNDLFTILSVFGENLADAGFMENTAPNSPVEVPSSDIQVKKLQAFLAQGETVRKDIICRLNFEGLEMKFYQDMDEVLSSPVRDLSQGLASLTLGELTLTFEKYTDDSLEVKAVLQSCRIDDIRPDTNAVITRILESCSGDVETSAMVSVRRPALAEALYRRGAARSLDARVDRVRLNLPAGLAVQLARALLQAVPADKSMEGGVVNQGYVGDLRSSKRARLPSSCDTSGYYSTATTTTEDTPGLSISIQFRQPEIMFFPEYSKHERHAILIRTELLFDYSFHCNTENLVISLPGFQILSRVQSKLKSIPPQIVLKPCDLEFSKSFKNMEEGVKVNFSVSEVEFFIAGSTIRTVLDIIEEVTNELTMSDDSNIKDFHFTNYPRSERSDEELWSPKKVDQTTITHGLGIGVVGEYESPRVLQTCVISAHSISIVLVLEQAVRVPVFLVKSSLTGTFYLSPSLHGSAQCSAQAWAYSPQAQAWEPSLEPVVLGDSCTPWAVTVTVHQGKSYPISTRINTQPVIETPKPPQKKRNKNDSESELDTDNEMMFIKDPNASSNKGYNEVFVSLDVDESDSENEGMVDRLSTAMGHLFADDSSTTDLSNEEDSSAPGASEAELSEPEADGEIVGVEDEGRRKAKTVKLQEPSDSEHSLPATPHPPCTYVTVSAPRPLRVTVSSLSLILAVLRSVNSVSVVAERGEMLVNLIGPGSTVVLKSRAETDLGGNPRVIAVADYDDTSRPSTPGGYASDAEILDDVTDTKPEMPDITDELDCFEGGFTSPLAAPPAPAPPRAALPAALLLQQLTDQTLAIRIHNFDALTIPCPQRPCAHLHVLYPSKDGVRYYVAVERTSDVDGDKIVVRSPLQIRNETSYPLELLQQAPEGAAEATGNPFCRARRLCVVAPADTCTVPLEHCYTQLWLRPPHLENFQMSSQPVWWKDLAKEVGVPRDVVCISNTDEDKLFAMRVIAEEGIKSHKITRAIPNYVIRVVPPLHVYNRLPLRVHARAGAWQARVEAGERATSYCVGVHRKARFYLQVNYLNAPWSGSFSLTPATTDKTVHMTTDVETDGGNKQLSICVKVDRSESCQIIIYAPYWIINNTNLPLQMKGRHSDVCHELPPAPLLWAPPAGPARVRFRACASAWSACAALHCCACVVLCAHRERRTHYRLCVKVTLSELCPQLTKIVTILPYFLVYNDTKRHLRYMEENEAADLWMDLAPQQCTAFWPQTNSMKMHCKFRDSTLVSQHFAITKNHFTVLRMDKGSSICVDVTGGTDRPFTITFKPYTAGDAPVRIDNLCDDLFLKLHQQDSGQVALLSPYQSLLYTWDDPTKDRVLMWNIYNNKGKGFVADFCQDGYGEEKVSFHSVKHTALVATNSVTSKLSSTLKRLTPKSPEPCSSSSEDSDNPEQTDTTRHKKMRKDKVIVYWISFMDGYQRVFALAQDEKIAYQYRMKIVSERSIYEVYTSIANFGLSVCVPTCNGVKELTYISVNDSLPIWEVSVSRKWKQLTPELTSWIEDKYQTEQKKCQLKDYLHVDLEKMQMTKPFFAELRRTYNPGIWMQFRKSESYMYCHLKLHRLQIDNQLDDAVYPVVLHSALHDSKEKELKPCIEFAVLKQHRAALNQDVYKYLKVLVQEFNVNLDRGFVNYVFDILNHWNIEEKPAVRLRADLALVHMPLPVVAMKSQTNVQKNILFEFVHLSPIKMVLSLSSRGYSGDNTSPGRGRFGYKKENRPKLFNSDLLEYLFNSWGSSLCDIKDVVIRLAYLELHNAPITSSAVFEAATRHYWMQLVQQFYVYVLGLKILGNPYSYIGDFTKGLKNYYEPSLASVTADEGPGASAPRAGRPALFDDLPVGPATKLRLDETRCNDLPECVLEADSNNPAAIALALTGLIARPSFAACAAATRVSLRRACAARELRRAPARARLPRHCAPQGITPYCYHSALGARVMSACGASGAYLAHAHLSNANTLLLADQNLYLVRAGGGAWRAAWRARLRDLLGVPEAQGDKLVIHVKQDESNYFATDEKIIEVSNPELLAWLQDKIECALIMALEDKRIPEP